MAETQQLTRAPLIYVLAQVRTTPVLSIAKFVPEIQERLRGKYPRFNQHTIQALSFGPEVNAPTQETIQRWEFIDKAGTTGFILDQASLILHTTEYPTFKPFVERLREGLEVIVDVTNVSLIERLGLRYVDLIEAVEGQSVADYVDDGLRGFPLDGVSVNMSVTRTESKARTKEGQIVAKYVEYIDGSVLPNDLMPISLAMSKTPAKDVIIGHLDIDHFQTETFDFEVDEIVHRMWSLHDTTSKVFKATATNFAMESWK